MNIIVYIYGLYFYSACIYGSSSMEASLTFLGIAGRTTCTYAIIMNFLIIMLLVQVFQNFMFLLAWRFQALMEHNYFLSLILIVYMVFIFEKYKVYGKIWKNCLFHVLDGQSLFKWKKIYGYTTV
ncbi:hypothetical protein ACJX0J_031759 [Zea mays]